MKTYTMKYNLGGAKRFFLLMIGIGLVTNLYGELKISSKKDSTPVVSTSRMLNPISPPGLYIADPEVRQMPDGRVYLYGSRDEPGNAWCSHSYHVLSTSDLVHWEVEQFSFATQGIGKQTDYTDRVLYAPDCIYHEGKYYLYYCLAGSEEDDEGVAVATSPYGPFKNGTVIKGAMGIDPSVFIDDDGQAYLFWGQAHARGAKLSKDMLPLKAKCTITCSPTRNMLLMKPVRCANVTVSIIIYIVDTNGTESPTVPR